MSNHLQECIGTLRGRIARMTAQIQGAVEDVVQAFLGADAALARQVVELDRRIDEEEVQIEKEAIDLLALHQPAARDLRLVTTIIKANSDLERIADCAVNIAHRVITLAQLETYSVSPDLRLMATSTVETLRRALQAFNLSNEAMARQTLRDDDVIDALYHQIFTETLGQMQKPGHNANVVLATLMIAKNLERLSDHCMNIVEDVIYLHTGRIIRHKHALEQA